MILDPTPAMLAVGTLLTTAGIQRVYWPNELIVDASGALVPPSGAPDKFIIIYPTGSTPRQAWGQRRYARQRIQLGACGSTLRKAGAVVATINTALPATKYHVTQVQYLTLTAGVSEYPVLIEVIT